MHFPLAVTSDLVLQCDEKNKIAVKSTDDFINADFSGLGCLFKARKSFPFPIRHTATVGQLLTSADITLKLSVGGIVITELGSKVQPSVFIGILGLKGIRVFPLACCKVAISSVFAK